MHPELSDPVFARAVVRRLGDRLLSELTVLKDSPHEESIHDTRVQSRRLRAALEAFDELFPPYPWKALYQSIRHITRALGRPRETEVLLAMLKELTSSRDIAENMCREYLQELFQKKLQKQERQLKRDLQTIDSDRLRSKIEFLLAGLDTSEAEQAIPTQEADPDPEPQARQPREGPHRAKQATLFPLHESALERGRQVIVKLAKPVLSFRTRSSFRRASDQRLHELRITGKKLRYAMEIFSEVWPGGLEKEIGLARALQEAAGQHQDWAVLREEIRSEIRRLTRQETTHLAFQMGRLLALVEDRKAELRKATLPALTELQAGLQALLNLPEQAADLRPRRRQKVERKL